MHIVIAQTSPVPLYEQIVEQIRSAILAGELQPGDPLPSLRRLARDLEVSLITTTRAYNDLAAAGFIANLPGRGSVVAALDAERIRAELDARIDDAIDAAARFGRFARRSETEMIERMRARWAAAAPSDHDTEASQPSPESPQHEPDIDTDTRSDAHV